MWAPDNFSALTNHEMCADMWGEFSLRSWSMLGAEHTSCQSPIWGFPAFPWFFLFFTLIFLLPERLLVKIKKRTKPFLERFSYHCCYFSFINYWFNYVIQSIQSTGPSYSDTSTRTRTGTDSKILTIEQDNFNGQQ